MKNKILPRIVDGVPFCSIDCPSIDRNYLQDYFACPHIILRTGEWELVCCKTICIPSIIKGKVRVERLFDDVL
jgi:hypothetical protein